MSGVPRTIDLAAGRGAGARDRARDWAPPALLLIGLLVLWEVTVRALQIKQFILPSPLAIAEAWVTYLPELYAAARYTFLEIIGGLVIGATGGIVVGVITARYASMRDSLMPFAVAASSVPILAFAPTLQQLVRAGPAALQGDDRGGPVLLPGHDQHRPRPDHRWIRRRWSCCAPTRRRRPRCSRKLRVPNAMPYIFTALRLAVTLATIGAVVGEYFAAPRASLGQYIATYSAFLNFERSWAAIVFACAIGIGLYLVVVVAERLDHAVAGPPGGLELRAARSRAAT